MSETATVPDVPAQPELPGLAEQFAHVGVDSLPLGLANLSKRERCWVLEYLRTGNATEAARIAGYRNPESHGGKVRNHAGVAACLAQAGAQVAKNADQLVLRASERSRALHDAVRAQFEKPDEKREYPKLYKLLHLVERADSLLGSLLGKIKGVHLSGEVNHNHTLQGDVALTLPATALPVLAQMRRDVTPMPAGGRN